MIARSLPVDDEAALARLINVTSLMTVEQRAATADQLARLVNEYRKELERRDETIGELRSCIGYYERERKILLGGCRRIRFRNVRLSTHRPRRPTLAS